MVNSHGQGGILSNTVFSSLGSSTSDARPYAPIVLEVLMATEAHIIPQATMGTPMAMEVLTAPQATIGVLMVMEGHIIPQAITEVPMDMETPTTPQTHMAMELLTTL